MRARRRWFSSRSDAREFMAVGVLIETFSHGTGFGGGALFHRPARCAYKYGKSLFYTESSTLMSRTHTAINDGFSEYLRRITVREPDVLRKLREETEDHPQASMQTAPEQGQFLFLL